MPRQRSPDRLSHVSIVFTFLRLLYAPFSFPFLERLGFKLVNILFRGDVVSVKKAFYGRKDLNICAAHPSEIKNKNCESNPLEEVQAR